MTEIPALPAIRSANESGQMMIDVQSWAVPFKSYLIFLPEALGL